MASASHGFNGRPLSPFFFKLKAKFGHAICGYGLFFRFERLPDSIAWEWFGTRNCSTYEAMRERIWTIRQGFGYHGTRPRNEIGCILIVQPVFFAENEWIAGPSDWPGANLRHKRYDLTAGEKDVAYGRSASRKRRDHRLRHRQSRHHPERPRSNGMAHQGSSSLGWD